VSGIPADQPSTLGALLAQLQSRPVLEPRAGSAYVQLFATALFVAGFIALTDFTYDGSDLSGTFLCLLVFGGCGLGARWLGFGRLGGATESMVLIAAVSIAAPLCAALLASTNRPLADDALALIDRMLFFGLERRMIADAVADWPPLVVEATRLIYHSLAVQPYILVTALFLARQERRAWTFVSAWMGALILSVAIFPLAPAFGTPPYSLDFMSTLQGARDGTLRTLGTNALTGIVTFPSFHAAASIVLGWGFSSLGRAALPFVLLNALMFASALFAGGHYLVDLLAGAAIGCLAIVAAERMQSVITCRLKPAADA
jgi:membrane-associated phospholipid phosphatase